jgi:ZIP family zinc transporter
MREALFWGLLCGSSLVLGAVVALRARPADRTVGLVMAFGSGVLVSAVAYELVLEASHEAHGSGWVAFGFFAGVAAFFGGNLAISRAGGGNRKRVADTPEPDDAATGIVLGTVLDGVPEAVVVGVSLLDGGGVSVAVVAAVFLSNFPEALAATSGLVRGGMPPPRILGMWAGIMLLTGLAAAAGYGVLGDAPGTTIAFVQAFAGGAIITMLASTMVPEAYEHGGRLVGPVTALGFAVAFALAAT